MSSQRKDRVFRTRAKKLSGHWHVRVFTADGPHMTFANVGTLIMDDSDYGSFTQRFTAEHLEEIEWGGGLAVEASAESERAVAWKKGYAAGRQSLTEEVEYLRAFEEANRASIKDPTP